MIAAVVFDLDGVLLDSEQVWSEVKREAVRDWGGRWHEGAAVAMMGMSSLEWSAYIANELEVDRAPAEIDAEVVRRMQDRYRRQLPLLSGAVEAVERLASRWPLGLASSSNRVLIDEVLETAGLSQQFRVTVSSEEVERGKPAPDVYLEAARRLGVEPTSAAAVEDSAAGIRSASKAGMRVIVIANPHYPPDDEAMATADVVLASLDELSTDLVDPG